MKHVFVGLPDTPYEKVYLYDQAGKKARHVLWGDWLRIDEDSDDPNSQWCTVLWAWNNPEKKKKLKIKRSHTSDQRPLEIIFVDVGQGDGAVLITPERNQNERIMVIDAGKGDHMGTFLDKRFGAYRGFKFHAAIITHPDNDHYLGFQKIFDKKVKFKRLYHNGLAERPVSGKWAKVGGTHKDSVSNIKYVKNLIEDDAAMRATFAAPVKVGRFEYPNTIRTAIDHDLVDSFEMLSRSHGSLEQEKSWVPGFAPSNGRDYTIEVVGPIVEPDPATGSARLRKIGDYGKTKNGHSVLLRLSYHNFTVLFGGDLNFPAEKFLLTGLTGMKTWPRTVAEREEMIARATPLLRSDIMKTCHHGSSDVTDEFLEVVNPAAFVISSGDQEGHVHPRPDLLGRLGKFGRGSSPVLLSTELQRSTRDRESEARVKKIQKLVGKLQDNPNDSNADILKDEIASLGGSNVDVDGAIYLKTDGDRMIAAFKKETNSATDKWFYFEYQLINGRLLLIDRKGH